MDQIKAKVEQIKKHENYTEMQEEKLHKIITESKLVLYKRSKEEIIPYFEFLYIQISFIKKRWWLFQAGVLALLWYILYVTQGHLTFYREIGILIPVFVILAIPELWKNIHSKSWEIESTTIYSLRQIYSARLLLFGSMDLLMLSIFFVMSKIMMQITFYNMVIQCMLPFTLTCCICFGVLCSKRFSSEYIAIIFCIIGAAIWYQIVLNTGLYKFVSWPVWLGMLGLLVIYFVFMIRKLLKNCTQYCEVNLIWS